MSRKLVAYFSAGGKHFPGMLIQYTALQDIRRADRFRVRVDPEGIGVGAAAEQKGKRQLYGTGGVGQTEGETFDAGQGTGRNPE